MLPCSNELFLCCYLLLQEGLLQQGLRQAGVALNHPIVALNHPSVALNHPIVAKGFPFGRVITKFGENAIRVFPQIWRWPDRCALQRIDIDWRISKAIRNCSPTVCS